MALSFFGLLALIVVGSIAAAFAVILVRIFSPRDAAPYREANMPRRHRSGSGPVVAMLFAGVVLLGLLVVGSWVTVARVDTVVVDQSAMRTETVQKAQQGVAHTVRVEAVPEDGRGGSDTVSEGGSVAGDTVPENGWADASSLPHWTKTAEQTVTTGQVPTVRRVVQSGLYATQDEASRAAMLQVRGELRTRLSEGYPQFASWTIPLNTIETHCVKQKYVEVRQIQFGEVSEPMYQVWLQYEDSPHVRDPIIAEWERSAVDGRSRLYVAGAGLLALLLGTISAGTRMLIAPKGSKGRAAFATVALGLGTGLAAFTLFVG